MIYVLKVQWRRFHSINHSKSGVIVMARQPRIKSATGVYHVMLRGNERKPVFLDDEDKNKFVDIMLKKKDGSAIRLYAYCVMDNHVHAVIQEVTQPLDRFMKRIAVTYAAYFNKKHHRTGHVFQDRFRSEAIENEAYLLSVIRYIHNNPFKLECGPTVNYLWSSYPSYIGYKESSPLLPEMIDILEQFSANRKDAIQRFCEFHLAKETQHLFLDIVDENDENAEDLLQNFLQSHSMLIEDLQKNDNKLIVAELLHILISESKISCRQMSNLTGVNREKVRKMVASLKSSSAIQYDKV